MHPEAEMSRYLTAQGFANTPPMLGEVVRVAKDGERSSLAVAQGFVRNQGDAWSWTLDQFNRALDDIATREADHDAIADEVADYTAIAAAIGRRLGEMHAVLALPAGRSAFAPETASEHDAEAWADRAVALLERAFALAQEAIELGERDGRSRGQAAAGAARSADARVAQARQGGRRQRENPHPRRLPPRAGAGRERRRLHHRLRGRARPTARRAAREGEPVARCRGPVALVRLRGRGDARSEEHDGGAGCRTSSASRL